MKVRIAGIADDSVVDGEGCRLAVFVQGCPHRCPCCQNPETHSFEGGRETDTAELLERFRDNPLLSGITLSGGEPFCQPLPMLELARAVHAMGRDVWAYTGYTLETLQDSAEEAVQDLLREVDVLVDGPYLEEQRDLALHFRGSRNQRVIDMKKTRQAGRVVLRYTD